MLRDAIVLLLYCGLIFFLSHQPSLPTVMAFPHQDKLVHASAYAVMALLAWRVFVHFDKPLHVIALIALLFCSLYGVSDEYHQSFIDGRDADVWDWFADTVGAGLMISLLFWQKYKL